MKKPVIFLAFANNVDHYLSMINRERKNIFRALRRHHDEGLLKVEAEASSSIEDIFELFNHYDNEIAIFHYGGHAGGAMLQFQDDLSNQNANAGGLAQLFGQQEGLQLVFLNGCATKGQVDLLLNTGVKAVIATSVPIEDKKATEFAEQFYNAIASHSTISRAFDIAKSFILTKYQDFGKIKVFRDFTFGEEITDGAEETMPWGLYVSPGNDEALQWSLPKKIRKKQVIKNRFDYETRVDVNDILIETICEELAAYNKDLDDELNKEVLDIPSIKREIVDSFPTPIGEQLRKLFTRSNNPGVPDEMELFSIARLAQITKVYQTIVQFISFTLLSQLWDEKYKNAEIEITEDYIVSFNSFFAIDESNYPMFDYVKLITTIMDVFDHYKVPYFIEELYQIKLANGSGEAGELYQAYTFMNSVIESLLDNTVDESQLEELNLEAEYQLGIMIKDISFLVKYDLVTIKNIEIVKNRHEKPRFRHSKITLNRALTVATTGVAEVGIEFKNFTDNKSVLFLKTKENEVIDYLNLTPFIIDENALNNDFSSKLYLFSFHGENKYYYHFLNNLLDEPLIVDENSYPEIKEQVDRFKAEIFGKTYVKPEKKTLKRRGKSRFSRKN